MKLTQLLSAAALVAFTIASPAFATSTTYTAVLNGASEHTPNNSAGTGTATFTLNGDLLTVGLTFANLSAPASAGHIHCCSAIGSNAAIVLPFSAFPSATSGIYNHTYDLSTFLFSNGGTEASLIAGLNNGLAYANIHDMNFPSGEIRGQIEPSPTPEPGSILLTVTGLAGVAGALRRRLRA